jgi:hypothetical protein
MRRILTMVLVHLFLMLVKIEFVHAGPSTDPERFNVACLIFRDAPILS